MVVIQTDDQAYGMTRFMDTVKRRIRNQGTTFTQDNVNWPLCCPSRATLLSGQYAHNHGVLGNGPPDGGVTAFNDAHALPVWLSEAGYRTAHVGEYLKGYGITRRGYASNPRHVPPGWDQWHTTTKRELYVYDYQLNHNGRLDHYGTRRRHFKQDVLTRHALRFVRRSAPGADPFYLQLDYTAPHNGGPKPSPQPPRRCDAYAKPAPRYANAFEHKGPPRPPSFNERDVSDKPRAIRRLPRLSGDDIDLVRQRYGCQAASLLSVDDGVREILSALRRAGELDETLVIFTSDNGFFSGEHRVPGRKRKVYDPSRRVPLMLRGPGVPAGQAISQPVTNADIAPTVADAAAATPDIEPDGVSLLPLAADPAGAERRSLLLETDEYTAVRTSRYLWAEYETGETELYDLDNDPHELRSRHDSQSYAAAREQLAQRLADLRACAGAECAAVPDYTDGP